MDFRVRGFGEMLLAFIFSLGSVIGAVVLSLFIYAALATMFKDLVRSLTGAL